MSRRSTVVVAFFVTLLMQLATTSEAKAPDAQGWWWATRDLLPVEVPPPADVPEDGLYVGANPTGEEAISAVMFVLAEEATASTLALEVAGTIAGTAQIRMCPTIASWQAAQGGSWAARPKYACTDTSPVGTVAAEGTSVTFTLGALGNGPVLDVALVPVAGANFRAAFTKPGPQALTVRSSPPTTPSGSEEAMPIVAPVPAPEPAFVPEAASVSTPIFAADFSSTMQPAPQVASEPAIGAAPQLGLVSRGVPVARPVTSGTDKVQSIGMFGLILLAALFSRYSSQQQRPPRSLVNFGHGEVAADGALQP